MAGKRTILTLVNFLFVIMLQPKNVLTVFLAMLPGNALIVIRTKHNKNRTSIYRESIYKKKKIAKFM